MIMRSSESGRRGTAITLSIAVVVILLILVEGCSSLFLGIYSATQSTSSYQEYHETYGWVGRKNAFFPDFFGPKKYLKINGQGFREDLDTPIVTPPGKVRVICSGNSFTFGQGVANDETWCHLLASRLPQLTTVNLGQSGYGVDQSYLWYLHAGRALGPRFHVFAFIGADLDRMSVTSMWDTGKPKLRLAGDRIELDNVPVPRVKHWLTRKAKVVDLRAVEFIKAVLARVVEPASPPIDNTNHQETKMVARKVFEELVAKRSSVGEDTLFVYLPTMQDLGDDTDWRTWTRSTMAELNFPFVDLTPSMRKLPASEVANFFITGGDDQGHYTEIGNRWVAENLSSEIARRM